MPQPSDRGSGDRGLVITDVDTAVDRLRAGGVVAVPTETVYGLAADAENPSAVARIFEIKGRPAGHPLIVHLADADQLRWTGQRSVPPAARVLTAACWPGPLTVLLERGPRVLDIVTGGRPAVGIRVPSHPMTLELLDRFGGGIAAPSANRFGRVSPTTAAHVVDDLGALLDPARDAILDGGPTPVGVESTIVDCTVDPPQILRPGGIPTEDIVRLLGRRRRRRRPEPPRASGMLDAHYAPRCEVRLAESAAAAEQIVETLRREGMRVDVLDGGDDLVDARPQPVRRAPARRRTGARRARRRAPAGAWARPRDPRPAHEGRDWFGPSRSSWSWSQSSRLRFATHASRTASTSGEQIVAERRDRDAHGAGTGVGHDVEPAPAVERLDEMRLEHVRRIVDEHLPQPVGDDDQRLERLDRERLDRERRIVGGDPTPPAAGRASSTGSSAGGLDVGRRRAPARPGSAPSSAASAAALIACIPAASPPWSG